MGKVMDWPWIEEANREELLEAVHLMRAELEFYASDFLRKMANDSLAKEVIKDFVIQRRAQKALDYLEKGNFEAPFPHHHFLKQSEG
jgi:hypothetical protein